MEQPISRERNRFLEELSQEGERLWEQAGLEGWFVGSTGGSGASVIPPE